MVVNGQTPLCCFVARFAITSFVIFLFCNSSHLRSGQHDKYVFIHSRTFKRVVKGDMRGVPITLHAEPTFLLNHASRRIFFTNHASRKKK